MEQPMRRIDSTKVHFLEHPLERISELRCLGSEEGPPDHDEAKRTRLGSERTWSKAVEVKLAAEVQALRAELSRVERRYTNDRRLMEKAYEEKIDGLQRQLLQQSDDIESAKTAVTTFMDQNRSFTASDSDIQSWFEARARGWYEWAKDNAHHNFSLIQSLPPEHAAELHQQCEEFARIENNEFPSCLLKHKISRVPYLLLHGLLANFICNEVFASPLWIVGACGFNDETDPSVVQQSVAELYRTLQNGRSLGSDQSCNNTFRSLNSLSSPLVGHPPLALSAPENIRARAERPGGGGSF
ncbi:uncharacterized protein E0L32_003748 [Thyridium curvatum]|uniref:Uncharacterized protein n=1 Tax=Thyridium curvatum TaxID=1093900 RepID=A0A507BCR1_9PEZI|nr:uncharacterized protein E0L32_003748 [Thyridium curvatum]TPX16454.1 hypothetical protein E0L32_003748 [Thyridium curvatum]